MNKKNYPRNISKNSHIRVVIIDDEGDARKIIEKLLSKYEFIKIVGKANEAERAKAIILKTKPDLLILDIQMPGTDGFQLLDEIKLYNISPDVIFVTARNEDVLKAIKHAAFDYLLKPIDPEDFDKAIQRFKSVVSTESFQEKIDFLFENLNKTTKVKFKTTGGEISVEPEDLMYVFAEANKCQLYFGNNVKEHVIVNIGRAEEILPRDSFIRINRSYVLNIKYLKRIDKKTRKCYIEKAGEVFEFNIPVKQFHRLVETGLI